MPPPRAAPFGTPGRALLCRDSAPDGHAAQLESGVREDVKDPIVEAGSVDDREPRPLALDHDQAVGLRHIQVAGRGCILLKIACCGVVEVQD